MIQKEDKTGYDVYEENTWPTDGYTFNSELSGCIDNYGSIVENSMTYNKDTNIITIDTGVTSSCYVYFDIKKSSLGEYIINNSISGLDKNLIGTDTLYRFSGTTGNEGINNYICLGTSTKCSSGSDDMYRIIGVEPSTGYVKVIKQTKYGSNIPWDSSAGVTWPESEAYSTMTTWYNSVSFKSMIVSHSWNIGDVGGYDDTYIGTRSTVMSYEDNTTTTAYVGMLALSDYYLAYRGDQNWNSSYSNYTSNWIHLENNGSIGDTEWTMSRYYSGYAWDVNGSGCVGRYNMEYPLAVVRPVFYLNSTVNRISGSGTSGDPFIVNMDVAISSTINNNNSTSATLTFTSNKSGTYCVNTSSTATDMSNCTFSGNITKDVSVTTSIFSTGGEYYVHIKDNAGNIGISSKVTVTLATPLGQYIIDNSISGLEKSKIGTDTLYRFSGTSGNSGINNYICLGTSTKCASGSDNMYRIIGVEPSTGYVKVIKQIKYGSNIYWNSSTGVTWPNSGAYNTMTTWYNSVSFKNMIVSHSWNIGDFTSGPTTRANALSSDTGNSTTAYVGMLAVSDYYLAYKGDQNWYNSYSNYTNNWIHLANNGNTSDVEWTMSRYSSSNAWLVYNNGFVRYTNMNLVSRAVRPVFYLNSTVNRISGSGTSGDPFIVG